MGYKLLGFVVWQGGKWYARRRIRGARGKLIVAGGSVAALGALAVAAQRQSDDG